MRKAGPDGAKFERSPVWRRLERANCYQSACSKEDLTAGDQDVLVGTRKEAIFTIKVWFVMYRLNKNLASPGGVPTSTSGLPAVRPPFEHAN